MTERKWSYKLHSDFEKILKWLLMNQILTAKNPSKLGGPVSHIKMLRLWWSYLKKYVSMKPVTISGVGWGHTRLNDEDVRKCWWWWMADNRWQTTYWGWQMPAYTNSLSPKNQKAQVSLTESSEYESLKHNKDTDVKNWWHFQNIWFKVMRINAG